MTFRDREKDRYSWMKALLFSPEAQQWGSYNNRPREFCLADQCSVENLYSGIREPALAYFRQRNIRWHDGLQDRLVPSNHLCCSQSCCLNFLFPLATRPTLVAKVFRHIFPDVVEALPITGESPLPNGTLPYLAFEWIGVHDYLGEHVGKRGERTRGANYTSADFVLRFRRQDGKVHLVLGEWKYTEDAGSRNYGVASTPSDRKPEVRRRTYRPTFFRPQGIFASQGESMFDALFVGPFYQLMRLQILAQEMESGPKGPEMEADQVSVLWICPGANREFRKTSALPEVLRERFPGQDPLAAWQGLVPAGTFAHLSTEDLLDILESEALPVDPVWVKYLRLRYGWTLELA